MIFFVFFILNFLYIKKTSVPNQYRRHSKSGFLCPGTMLRCKLTKKKYVHKVSKNGQIFQENEKKKKTIIFQYASKNLKICTTSTKFCAVAQWSDSEIQKLRITSKMFQGFARSRISNYIFLKKKGLFNPLCGRPQNSKLGYYSDCKKSLHW